MKEKLLQEKLKTERFKENSIKKLKAHADDKIKLLEIVKK